MENIACRSSQQDAQFLEHSTCIYGNDMRARNSEIKITSGDQHEFTPKRYKAADD